MVEFRTDQVFTSKKRMIKGSNLLRQTSHQLFEDADERQRFVEALCVPPAFPPAIIWSQARPTELPPAEFPFVTVERLPWQPEFVDRIASDQNPEQHAWVKSGAIYCTDLSLIFASIPLQQLPQQPAIAMDVCATFGMQQVPGAQTLYASRALAPVQMLSNEALTKRTAPLIENLQRWRVQSVAALRSDTNILAEVIPQTAAVVIVNAPSSAQTLLAQGGEAPGCFYPVNIAKNATRQKRILMNSVQLLAPQGHLLYTTSTYTPDENERVVEWLLERCPHLQPISVPPLAAYQSTLTNIPCYRLFPQSGLGAGAFTVLLQNMQDGQTSHIPETFFNHPSVTLL